MRGWLGWGAMASALLGAATGCVAWEGEDAIGTERVGAAALPVDPLSQELPVSTPGESAVGPSVAWIRSSSFSNGTAVVGYTEGGWAAWAYSQDWTSSAPTWDAHRADEPPPFGWPVPDNFCKVYDCASGAQLGGYHHLAQMVWTGLDDVAAAVAVSWEAVAGSADVVLVTSIDGGQTFTEASILSIPGPEGDSGGVIDVSTVHASLLYAPERANAQAGQQALPIYVIWQNDGIEGRGWWMTKAVVGVDGSIAQLTLPKQVTIIPQDAAAHASIAAFLNDDLQEGIDLVWSERTDADGNPSPGPSCPSKETITVEWWKSWTVDFGTSWGCWPSQSGESCGHKSWVLDSDAAWRPCVGASFSEVPGAPPHGVNNDRPEILVQRGLPYNWYIGINRSVPGEEGMRVVLWRFRATTGWQQVFSSPSEDPADGRAIGDAWGQSMALLTGNASQSAILALTWRHSDRDGLLSMAAATSITDFGVAGSWSTTALEAGPDVPWEMTDQLGRYTGTAALELCVNGACPGGAPAAYPKVPFVAAWPDNRGVGVTSDVWARAFNP